MDETVPAVILPTENNRKIFHPCDIIPCNIMNYLNRYQIKRYIVMCNMAMCLYII